MKFKTAILSLLMTFSGFTWADCNDKACYGKLNKLYPSSTGKIYISFSQDMSKLNCSLVEGRYLTLKSTHVLRDQIYSMLLASVVSGKNVAVRISTGTNDCSVMYSYMDSN